MTARKICFSGEITAVSPINISVFRDKTDKNEPMGIPTHTVMSENGGKSLVPTVPGYNFKGALRHRAVDVLRDILAEAGQTDRLDLDAYYLNAIGGVKGSESEDVRNILRMRELRAASPLLGLFGAAVPHFIQGCLNVNFADAQPGFFEYYNEKGVRTDAVRRRPALLTELAGDALSEYADYVSDRAEVRDQKSKVTALGSKIAAARKAGNDVERKALESELTAERKTLETMSAETGAQIMRPIERRGIAAGTQFPHTMTLVSPTDAELGLMLAALKRFAANCRLGGLENIGFGQIKASWTIENIDLKTLERTRLGSVKIADCEFEADLAHETLQAAIAAWDAFVADPSKIAVSRGDLDKVIAA